MRPSWIAALSLVAAVSLLVACATRSDEPGAKDRPLAGAFGVVVPTPILVSSLPNRWAAAEGWILTSIRIVGDLNGDGYLDAAVGANEATATSAEGRLYFVNGPLMQPRTIPGDHSAVMSGYALETLGDATGDGIVDFVLTNYNGEGTLVLGPVEGEIDVDAVGVPIAYALLDANGDGVLDKQTQGEDWSDDAVHLTWGPMSRFGGPADLVIAPECGLDNFDWITQAPRAYPDVTGDGVRELWVMAYSSARGCGNYVLPLPVGGVVDPETLPGVARGVPPFTVIPDQNGDGAADVYSPDFTRILLSPVSFVSGPVSWVPEGEVTSDAEITIDPAVTWATPAVLAVPTLMMAEATSGNFPPGT